jgi:hypothetical protein
MGQSPAAVLWAACEVSHLCAASLHAILLSDCNPPIREEVPKESPGSLKHAGKKRLVGVVKLLPFTPHDAGRELLTSEHGRAVYRGRGVLDAVIHSEA